MARDERDPVRASGPGRRRAGEKASRVRWVADLMATGRWMGRASVEAGAAEWGVSEGEIARDAGEASRLIAGVLTSDGELRAHLEGMIATAARMAADEGGARGATALVQAAQTWARLRGVDAPVRVAGPAAERAQLVEALRAPSPELRGILADAGLLVAREGDET